MCGGKDRWRFTDFEQCGGWICNQCGRGDGIELVKRIFKLGYLGACERIEAAMQQVEGCKPLVKQDLERQRRVARAVWAAARPIREDCAVGRYLAARGLPWNLRSSAVRSVKALWCDGVSRPAMLAKVVSPLGKAVNIHRTFLDDAGRKADIEVPRRMMPGRIPEGSAVWLAPPAPIMGVAEGIETALAASVLFEMPVWSAVNALGVERFIPPKCVKELHIFADNDASLTGQAVAYALGRRLRNLGLGVAIRMPDKQGQDWNDFLIASQQAP
jgi:putative DNA primase/helicase